MTTMPASPPPRLALVIVNYCTAEIILEGLEQTLGQLDEIVGGAVCWIVDNASPDDSVQILRNALAQPPFAGRAELISSEHNGGFGYGNNIAIRRAVSLDIPYVYMLNPDAVPEPGAISALLGIFENAKDVGAAGSLLISPEGTAQPSFFRFPSLGSELDQAFQVGLISRLLRRHHISFPAFDSPQDVDWITGASFMVRTKTLCDVGFFDEDFFLYWEETELCFRIKAAGWRVVGVPQSVVAHIAGASTGMHDCKRRRPKYWFSSRNLYFDKTTSRGHTNWLNLVVAIGLAFRRSYHALIGRPRIFPHYFRDFIRHGLFRQS